MTGLNQSSNGAQPLLEVIGLHKRFTGVYALRGVTLSFERGQIYHLLGENGCGKSTLIKIISGAQPPDQGELVIEGVRHARLAPFEALSAGLQTGSPGHCVLPDNSGAGNVAVDCEWAQHRA